MATSWGRLAGQALRAALRAASPPRREARRATTRRTDAVPGDFRGTARIEYAPQPDGAADPGEVVWGWVPYEEDPTRGKDRPSLVVGRDGRWVLALMLTSKDHTRGQGGGPVWMDIGTGEWDAQRRPSEVRLDRVLRLDPDGIRREGAVLDRRRFDAVASRLRELHGWT